MTSTMNLTNGLTAMPEFIVSILLLWLVLYFLFMRPQRRKLAARVSMQKQVQPGNWVLLQSGMYAYVMAMNENYVSVGISADDTSPMLYSKTAIIKLLEHKPELT